jgi:glycosyltransferase involved in cell wall biosynthesis/tetratricopeptide (TPR) repeat protein
MKNIPQSQPQKLANTGARSFFLSLIIPCYNESARVEIMLQGLAEFEEKWNGDYEVIVVDDGSKDDTAQKIQTAITTKYTFLQEKLRVEKMPANGGKGSALKHGVSLAKGDHILTLDADMSTKPTELLNWEKKERDLFVKEDTIYIGSRKHEDGKVEALQSRRIIGGVFNSIVQILTTLQLKDTQCGFKLYPRKVALFLFGNMQSKGWAHDVELLYQADLNDIRIKEMPINWVNMPESKVNVVKDSMMMFIGVLTISLRIWLYNSFVLPFNIPADATAEQKKHIIYRSVFNVLALLLVIVMPMMSFQFGITGDEHWHFDYGNSIYNYFFHGDTEAQTATTGIQYYGGIFDFITAYVYNVFHLWDHYTTMHFINAIVGAIGIIYAGKLAKLFGGYNTAILAMVLLILSPSWFGHNFANPKDIPFSVGYTAGIYYIILFVRSLPSPSAKHLFGLVCSIGWAMGVRIGGFLLIAYLALFIGTYGLYTKQLKTVMNAKVMRQFVITAIAGYVIAIVFWPYAHLGIVSKPLEALKVMSNFFVNIGMLYDGKKILSNEVPWYYIPRYIAYTAPIIVLAGLVIGCVGMPVIFRKNRNALLFALFVLFTCVFPLAYTIYKKSSLYDGWRHFLFIYPPLVVLASIGWMALINSGQKALKYGAIAVVIAGLCLPAKYVAANHPFESLYYNEIAGGLKGMYGRYETDYYMLGMKPATEWLIKNEHLDTKKAIVATNCIYPVIGYLYQAQYKNIPTKYDRIYERFADFRHDDEYNMNLKQYPDFKSNFPSYGIYVRYNDMYQKDWDYCILFSRFVDASQLTSGNWPPAETIYTVKVDGVPIAAVLKRKTKKDLAGFELMKAKKIFEAKAMFLESLQEYPENEEVWEALSQIYDAEGKPDSAIYAGYQVLRRHPGDINTYQMIGSAYMKQHQADSAMKLYKDLEKYNPGYSHFFMAYAYATTGNGRAALGEIDNAIEADPHNEQAYKLGMQIAQGMKDQNKMEEYNEKARKAFPEQEGQ